MKFNSSAVSMFNQEGNGMQKTRATTLQQKFGFQDPDLTSPAHDAMMVWLDQTVSDWIRVRYQPKWTQAKIDATVGEYRQKITVALAEAEKKLEDARASVYEEEEVLAAAFAEEQKPLFWDAELKRRRYRLDECTKGLEKIQTIQESWNPGDFPGEFIRVASKTWESPVMAKNGFLVGFIDMRFRVEWNEVGMKNGQWVNETGISTDADVYLFEVKPTIQSAGELIRQIRMYQQYQRGTYVVVSPDDRFESVLAGQGIEFLKATV